MMSGNLRYGVFFVLVAIGFVVISCKKKSTTQQTANNAVLNLAANTHFTVQVYLTGHTNLLSANGSDTISNAGIRGLLIYRASLSGDDQFYVYERACTYDGTSNTKAMVFGANQTFTCKDNVCGSTFTMSDGSGQPAHGPATYALKQYKWSLDGTGNVLTVTN
jgi:Rieske Fe-S protein